MPRPARLIAMAMNSATPNCPAPARHHLQAPPIEVLKLGRHFVQRQQTGAATTRLANTVARGWWPSVASQAQPQALRNRAAHCPGLTAGPPEGATSPLQAIRAPKTLAIPA